MIIKTFGLILFFSSSQSKNIFMPNLPVGEYRIVVDKVYPCASTRNSSIQMNWYLSKKTSSITELKGNISLLVPLDDTIVMDWNFASWGSTGGWVPNAYTINIKKGCSYLKYLYGDLWFTFVKEFNIQSDKCPIQMGTYCTSGMDTKKFEDNNFPKLYFYGKYKVTCRYKNAKNEVIGCVAVEVNLIRPWETPI